MNITPLTLPLIPEVERLIGLGAPHVRVRGSSDYWLYSQLFASTCPVAIVDGVVAGIIIAFRSQDERTDIYVQDVMTHPDVRRRGVTRALLATVRQRAEAWGCERIYLTSEPENKGAHATWLSLGFTNVPGDHTEAGVSVVSDYKGPGKDRAVYELRLR